MPFWRFTLNVTVGYARSAATRLREFLAARYAEVKLVFSTYQLAHVVAAGLRPGAAFDLAIFDEAHKTAGREGLHFGFALSDRHLRIKKRLFLTATPRHYDLRQRDREGDARLAYSMDAPEIYGPVAQQLTYAEAARRGFICHYRVIISVVTSGMVNDHLLRRGEILVQGDAVQSCRSRRANECSWHHEVFGHKARRDSGIYADAASNYLPRPWT